MSKNAPLNELVSAIRLVHKGGSVLDLKAADKVVHYLTVRSGSKADSEELQSRELEVLKLTARGMSNKAIAEDVFISLGKKPFEEPLNIGFGFTISNVTILDFGNIF